MPAERRDWVVKHDLHRVHFTLRLDGLLAPTSLHAEGRSKTKRGVLWTIAEEFTPSDRYGAADFANHIALVALQDRPRNEQALQLALRGGDGWEDVQLPF